jgi:hypothetical protein
MSPKLECGWCGGYIVEVAVVCECGKPYHSFCAMRLRRCQFCGNDLQSTIPSDGESPQSLRQPARVAAWVWWQKLPLAA